MKTPSKTRLALAASVFLMLVCIGFLGYRNDAYYAVSTAFVLIALMPFFIRYEVRNLRAREIVLVAVLVAVASLARIPFAALPSVQPTTFVIIVSALALGAESGFMIGALAALVSNIVLGQGPWTPWQMLSWGLAGLSAGLLRNTRFMDTRWGRILFGFGWGFLFGWIMNISFALSLLGDVSWGAVWAVFAMSFYFDLLHAVSNAVFLGLFAAGWLRVMERFKRKYGLLGDGGADR